jgi:S1-C subfamily serine protease
MRNGRVLPILIFAGFIFFGSAEAQPSHEEIENLPFAPDSSVGSGSAAYTAVVGARGLFVAYRAESAALKKYRKPILTRGPNGESVFKNFSSSVVAVVVGSLDKSDNFNPDGLGTGVIVDSQGYVLTNWHVIEGFPGALIFLKPSEGSDLSEARLCGAKVAYQDPKSDLALLRIINPPSSLNALKPGDINQVQVAEDIHIIGHPHGNLWSYSNGVVSQIRDRYNWSYTDGSQHEAKVLQLQTAINPGNSGGPVLDDSGSILGLVAMSEEGQNLDYAIAADVIKQFLFLGMHMSTRSAAPSSPVTPAQAVYSARQKDGDKVIKFEYPDVRLFEIRNSDGTTSEVIGEFRNGVVIRGWDPDSNDQFRAWSADMTQGVHLVGSSSNGLLTSIGPASEGISLTR